MLRLLLRGMKLNETDAITALHRPIESAGGVHPGKRRGYCGRGLLELEQLPQAIGVHNRGAAPLGWD